MWEFFNNLLEKAGFVAVLYAVTIGALAFTAREFWKKLGEKEAERVEMVKALERAQAEKAAAVEDVRHEETKKRSAMRAAFDEQIAALAEERRKEALIFTERLASIQERRVQDAHTTVREAVEHIAETRQSVIQITHAMTTLERILRA